jgi:hypothetical protein
MVYVLQVLWRDFGISAQVQAHWNNKTNSRAIDIKVQLCYETIYERDIECPNWIRRKKAF